MNQLSNIVASGNGTPEPVAPKCVKLTPEQLQKIEQNRQIALARRSAKLGALCVNREKKYLASSSVSVPANVTKHSLPETCKRPLQNKVVRPCPPLPLPNKSHASASTSVTSTYGQGDHKPARNPVTKPHAMNLFYGSKHVNKNVPSESGSSLTTTCSVESDVSTQILQPLISKHSSDKSSMGSQQIPVPSIAGSCVLISENRFTVDVGYNSKILDVLKKTPSALYDASRRRWNCDLTDYHSVMCALKGLEPEIVVAPLPAPVVQTFMNKEEKPQVKVNWSRIEPKLVASLMPFQKEGVEFAISKNGRCLLADDMGLGKTIQSLAVAHYYRQDWPLLILSPTSVRYLWLEAVETWLPSIGSRNVTVMAKGKDSLHDALIVITSYDLLSRHAQKLKSIGFGMVIADESHFLKNFKSARTQAALPILKGANRVLMLSGTPALSRPSELYTQVKSINPALFPKFHEYGLRYCSGKKTNWGWDYSGSSNMEELHLLLRKRIMVRRLKSDVISQLPAKVRQVVILNPDKVKTNSHSMKSCVKNLSAKKLKGMEYRGAILRYFCSTGTAKLPAILDYVADLVESDKKFICFAHHAEVITNICDLLASRNRDYIKIDGSTPSGVRKTLCDKFQFDDNCLVAVLSITAANAGITLTAAQLVVFAELFWNPGILTQAEDRAHRIGQQDVVVVQYLVARGTADDHLWPLIQTKLDVLNKAGLSKDNFLDAESTQLQRSQHRTLATYFEKLGAADDIDCALDADIANLDEAVLSVHMDKLEGHGFEAESSDLDEAMLAVDMDELEATECKRLKSEND